MDPSNSLTLVYDGDLYEARQLSSRKWEIIRYPQSPLFKPGKVELTQLPNRLYDEFSAHFLYVSRSQHISNGDSEVSDSNNW